MVFLIFFCVPKMTLIHHKVRGTNLFADEQVFIVLGTLMIFLRLLFPNHFASGSCTVGAADSPLLGTSDFEVRRIAFQQRPPGFLAV